MSEIDEQIEALNVRRQKTGEAHEAARKVQFLADLTALADLEDEHGCERLIKVEIRGWKSGSGAVTMVVAKRPLKSDSLYKRFVDMARRATKGDKTDSAEAERAGEMLAQSCILYPEPPKKGEKSDDGAYEATIELAPGLLTSVAKAAVDSAMGRANEEGKD